MRWSLILFFFPLILLTTFKSTGQVIYEPSYHTVYSFLGRLAQKGVIDIDDVVQPLSKEVIYKKLEESSRNITLLTALERKELAFYLKEYTFWWRKDPKSGFEGTYQSLMKSKIGDRFRWVAYQDNNFTINVQPVTGYRSESIDSSGIVKNISQFYQGFWVYGYIGKNIGYSFDLRNSKVSPISGYDYLKVNSPEQGRIGYIGKKDVFDYNTFNGYVTAKWNWGSISFGKSPMTIGYGNYGKLILSEKAPSFPNLRLDLSLTGNLSFNYVHGWLNSDIPDSTSIRPTVNPTQPQYNLREKYYVEHSLTWKAFKGFRFTIGESVIHSDKLKVAYLIPIVLYSAVSHYLGEDTQTNTIANSQIFLQFSSRNHIPKSHLYFTFFIDEMRIKGLGIDPLRNHTGYQIGFNRADFLIPNLAIDIEYTRIRPFTYQHFIPVQTYQNSGYNLGHWIGTNADLFTFTLNYRPLRGLFIDTGYQHYQKGSIGTSIQQTQAGDYPFLWGNVISNESLFLNFKYEPVHDLFFDLKLKNTNTNSKQIGFIDIGVRYGF